MRAEIWTKEECIFCLMAKALFDRENIEYVEHRLNDETREEFKRLFPNQTTVPQIILDNEVVGGYTDLLQRLKG